MNDCQECDLGGSSLFGLVGGGREVGGHCPEILKVLGYYGYNILRQQNANNL